MPLAAVINVTALVSTMAVAAAPAAEMMESRPEGAPARTVLVWAPGYPGATGEAQATMDILAGLLEKGAGWHAGSLGAVYDPSLESGKERLARSDVILALVPLPLYSEFGAELELEPLAEATPLAGGGEEIWSLIGRRGALPDAASLAGWEITSRAGYAPGFVHQVLSAHWDGIPEGLRITFTPHVLGALRRAAAGEKVAVLLDAEQTSSLPSLPFAAELEIFLASAPQVSSLLCSVGQRLDAGSRAAMLQAAIGLDSSGAGRDLLATMRLRRLRAAPAAGPATTP